MTDDLAMRLAIARAEFKKIRLYPDYLKNAQRDIDVARMAGKMSRGEEQDIIRLAGPSHCGKSTIIKDYIEKLEEREPSPPGKSRVVYVQMTAKAKVQTLGADILRSIDGGAFPQAVITDLVNMRPSELAVRDRRKSKPSMHDILHVALRALELADTELLVLDEAHHLSPSETAVVTNQNATEAIKWLANEGHCPIVCIGTNRLRELLDTDTNPEVANRTECIDLHPLDYQDDTDFDIFNGFLDGLDKQIAARGLLPRESDFLKDDWPECFYDVTKGVVGRASKLIRAALLRAIEVGHDRITREDLDFATRRWAIRAKITTHNPWTSDSGARDMAAIRKEMSKLA